MISWVPKKKINHETVQALLQKSIASNHFTNGGPLVELLENRIRGVLQIDNTKAVVCVSNGTVALWATVAALELYHSKNMRFLTQSFTFPASAQGYLSNVIIVDIDKDGGLDIASVEPNDCEGIIVTNIFGNVVDIEKYEKWCNEHNKFLIFDNAATSYTFYKGKNSCNYGTASTISFHHTKPLGFGEGGCIIIDAQYERALRNILNFGIDNNAPNPKWHIKGGNYKMSDIQAAYILQYMDTFDSIIEKTINLYRYFIQRISNIPDIKTLPNFSDNLPFVSCICILIKSSRHYIEKLLENNVYCRKYYNPLIPSPNAIELYDNIVCIPCTVDMTIEDIDKIISIIE
jgi:dTDP-4-amino-4,6-dideoxygalactose transaminase